MQIKVTFISNINEEHIAYYKDYDSFDDHMRSANLCNITKTLSMEFGEYDMDYNKFGQYVVKNG